MRVPKTAARLCLFLVGLLLSGCGYLDHDLFVDDAQFGEELDFEAMTISGIGLSGYGSSGCGGFGYARHQARPRIRFGQSMTLDETTIVGHASLTDAEILANTNIDVIDETVAPTPGLVERAYYEQKAARDRSIVQTYGN